MTPKAAWVLVWASGLRWGASVAPKAAGLSGMGVRFALGRERDAQAAVGLGGDACRCAALGEGHAGLGLAMDSTEASRWRAAEAKASAASVPPNGARAAMAASTSL